MADAIRVESSESGTFEPRPHCLRTYYYVVPFLKTFFEDQIVGFVRVLFRAFATFLTMNEQEYCWMLSQLSKRIGLFFL